MEELMAITIDRATCTACESCVDTCPLELIEMTDGGAAINDVDSCIECGACVDACAVEAITL
jgi:NAD-dependent dihydropyrimidine dehydrogenase PreA subunit